MSTGNLANTQTTEFAVLLSNTALALLNKCNSGEGVNVDDIYIMDLILRISNILYNNTSATMLPLDDGLYDQLLVAYQKFNPNYQVGAIPVQFPEMNQDEQIYDENTAKKQMCTVIPERFFKMPNTASILSQNTPMHCMPLRTMCTVIQDAIPKRLINTVQEYPELVGTLDKCKFVLNCDARDMGVFEASSVNIFERDFMMPCVMAGLFGYHDEIEMIAELKYDGVSVDAKVCGDTIISAFSRGDTGEGITTDLTPIFGGFHFHNAKGMPRDRTFGIKFEAVITFRNLEILSQLRGKTYKNPRNAIIGLLGSSDAYLYRDLITLIPICTSLDLASEKLTRVDELEFLNMYYNSGEYNRYSVIKGDYMKVLYKINSFVQDLEQIRGFLPYMIDGVVISFTNPDIINTLGRVNSVNKYQMAIKFNPRKTRTTFLGYSYNIGKSGEVIPMVHYKPVEFIGGIHTKQTIHSFQRFKDLALVKGMDIDVEYVNDVISYVTRPDTPHNRFLEDNMPGEKFITHCPYCGTPIIFSDSGKSACCPNPKCHERLIMRMVYCIEKLGFKGFSEQTVRELDITTLDRLVTPYDHAELSKIIGPNNADAFIWYQENLTYNGSCGLEQFKVMSALSFDGMGEEKWKRILAYYTIEELFEMNEFELKTKLMEIKGIGLETANAIVRGFKDFHDDVLVVIRKMHPYNQGDIMRPKAVLTGTRDAALIQLIKSLGYDCDDSYGVTKGIDVLIAADVNSDSGKIRKAKKYGIPIISVQDFLKNHNISSF